MSHQKSALRRLLASLMRDDASARRRRPRQLAPTVDGLEDRVVLSHIGAFRHAHHAAITGAASTGTSTSTTGTSTSTTGTTTTTTGTSATGMCNGGSSSTNSAVTAAQTTLRNDIQTIEAASGTTVGELAAIRAAFQTLSTDGLTPSSQSALSSFEDSLVKAYTSGTTLANDPTLLAQFEAIYTATPTTQQTTDLTTAYNALAAAITSSNITAGNLTTIDTDYAALLSAEGSSSTATYPYFSLVTGQAGGLGGFGAHHGGHHGGR